MLFDSVGRIISEPQTIRLDTRTGEPIENEILPPPSPAEFAAARRKEEYLVKLFGARWEPRKPITPGYNCAGHVWATRRTAIIADDAVELILEKDGYRPIPPDEEPMQGDIVIYWNRTAGGKESWMHAGVVMELRPAIVSIDYRPSEKTSKIPWVLSKWNAILGEWLHRVDDAPFENNGGVAHIFYTDRPEGKPR